MNEEHAKVKRLLVETISTLCKNSLTYNYSLLLQGVIGITLDEETTFLVPINETIELPFPLKFSKKEKTRSGVDKCNNTDQSIYTSNEPSEVNVEQHINDNSRKETTRIHSDNLENSSTHLYNNQIKINSLSNKTTEKIVKNSNNEGKNLALQTQNIIKVEADHNLDSDYIESSDTANKIQRDDLCLENNNNDQCNFISSQAESSSYRQNDKVVDSVENNDSKNHSNDSETQNSNENYLMYDIWKKSSFTNSFPNFIHQNGLSTESSSMNNEHSTLFSSSNHDSHNADNSFNNFAHNGQQIKEQSFFHNEKLGFEDGKIFDSLSNYPMLIGSRFVCEISDCGMSFSNRQNLLRHQTQKHGRIKTTRKSKYSAYL